LPAPRAVVPVIDAGDIPIDPPTRPRGAAQEGSERKTIGVGTPIEAIRAQFGDEPAGPPNVPAESQTRILQKPRGAGTNKLLATVVGLMCVVLVFVVYVKFFGSGGNKKTTVGGGDVRPPKITIAKPVDDFVTRAKVVRVEGQVDDDSAQVTVEGRAVTVGADGWFFYDMDLPREGEFILDIKAQNRAGRLGEAAIRVTRDTKPPILRVQKPGSKPRVRAESYTVTGTVDAGTDTVVVNGHPADIDGESFRAVVPLSEEGDIKFEVVARDKAGNETLDTFVVTRDATAPRVELVFPPSGGQAFRTSEGVIEVRGSVDDGEATLTVGGAACVLNPDGTFRAVVELKEAGEQAIEIVVTDAVGNSARAEARVYQDTPLVIYEPRDGKTTNQADIRVRGRVYGSGTKVTINGTPVETDDRILRLVPVE